MKWLLGIAGSVLVAFITSWAAGFFNQLLPPPSRALLSLENVLRSDSQRPEDGFRVVLSWLEDDSSGKDTKNVEDAFSGVDGIKLVRSARIVEASGASEHWREEMRQSARMVLEDWNADLAVVGLVKKPGEVLSLWFVPRSGEGTLDRGDYPYKLEDVTLRKDFHDDLRAQLTAVALAAVAPLAGNEVRGRVLEKGLRGVTEQLSILLKGPTIDSPEHRANLHMALGNALSILGERESGTERLKEAVKAFRDALKVFTPERVPLDWAATQNDLGSALFALGRRESGTARLEEAVNAFRDVLKVLTPERVPHNWAATQNNLGAALFALGQRESDTARLEEAVNAFRAALKEYTRDRVPLVWAATQNNLGAALSLLGERESGTARLEEAVNAFRAALKVLTRDRVPLWWAATQNNLGAALSLLGRRESGTARLEEAVKAFRAALKERSRDRVPLRWAEAQANLGATLWILGKRESGTAHLEEAVEAFQAALEAYTGEGSPWHRTISQDNLNRALRELHEQGVEPRME